MYCPCCGIYTADTNACQICSANLDGVKTQPDVRIFVDLTMFPFRAILKSLKGASLRISIAVIPLVTILYFIKKFSKKKLLSPIFNSKSPKYHITQIQHIKQIHKKSVEPVLLFLSQHGFEPLIDLEDKSMVHGNFHRYLINQDKKIYATVHINKMTGKLQYVTFYAFTSENTFISVNNTYVIPIQYPQSLVIEYFPDFSVESTYDKFWEIVDQRNETPVILTLRSLISNGYKIRNFSVEQGLKQKVLQLKGKTTPGAETCYHHPFSAAIRRCSSCNTSLCEACYTSWGDEFYCQACLQKVEKPPALPSSPITKEFVGYAGFGIRAFAAIIDGAILAGLIWGIYAGLTYGIRIAISNPAYTAVPFILTQLLGVGFTIGYLIIPIQKFGGTIGQNVLGLRVVDRHGNLPDKTAAVVRFAYHLFACLFIIPIAGYFFIIFRKTKQGLHDQLAGTFVAAKHAGRRILLSWVILLIACCGIGWYGYQWISPWVPFFRLLSPGSIKAEITLEPHWVKEFNDQTIGIKSYIVHGNRFIMSTPSSVISLDMTTGTPFWKTDSLSYPMIQYISANLKVPLLVVEHIQNKPSALINIDLDSGAVIWKIDLEIREVNVAADTQSIVVFGENKVYVYDISGKILWKKQFQDKLTMEYAGLNKDVLIERYSETSQTLIYLSRNTGETLWELSNIRYIPGYAIGEGYQCMFSEEGKMKLMYLPEKKTIWEIPQSVTVIAHNKLPLLNGTTEVSYLYTTTSAIRGEDGSTLFSYPHGSRLACITDNFLVLLKNDKPLQNQKNEIILADKLTGNEVKRFQGKGWTHIMYLSEDELHIYMLANIRQQGSKIMEIASELLSLDKQKYELKSIPLGKNISSFQLKIFPDKKLVFIPTYQHIGAYKIPQ